MRRGPAGGLPALLKRRTTVCAIVLICFILCSFWFTSTGHDHDGPANEPQTILRSSSSRSDGGISSSDGDNTGAPVISSSVAPPPTEATRSSEGSNDGAARSSSLMAYLCAVPSLTAGAVEVEGAENGAARRAIGTDEALPPVTFPSVPFSSKMRRASLCASAEAADPSASPSRGTSLRISIAVDSADALRAQVRQLTLAPLSGDDAPFVRDVVITIVAPASSSSSQQEAEVGAAGSRESVIVAVVRFFDAPYGAVVVRPTILPLPADPRLLAEAVAAAAVTSSSRTTSDADAFREAIGQMGGARSSAGQRAGRHLPHFVFAMPHGALFSPGNVAGLCLQEPILNEESEARATYLYANETFDAYFSRRRQPNGVTSEAAGAAVDTHSRLPLGFIFPNPSQPIPPAPAAGDNGPNSDGRNLNPPPLTIVSSCRAPLTVAAPYIDGRHYTKGGDAVLRGHGRFAVVGGSGPSAAVVPFLGGVEKNMLLAPRVVTSFAYNISNEESERLFAMRRPLGPRCSSDPQRDPTRVLTVMPFYDSAKVSRCSKASSFLPRSLNATALMTPYSDVILVSNLLPRQFRDVMRRLVRLPEYAASPRYISSSTASATASLQNADDDGSSDRFMDASYPNPFGEFVLITENSAVISVKNLPAPAEWHVAAAKGFYDLVRYTEEDVYISQDQFAFFCATLPMLEARNEYLNWLRFDFDPSEMERTIGYDVRHAYVPDFYVINDNGDVPMREWVWAAPPSAVSLAYSPATNGGKLSPDGNSDNFNAEAVPIDACYAALEAEAAAGGGALPDLGFRLPLSVIGKDKGGREEFGRRPGQFDRTFNISGCYVLGRPQHETYRNSRIYNALYMVPDHRLGPLTWGRIRHLYAGPAGPTGLYREYIAHFRCPLLTYDNGVVVFNAYPSSVMREGGEGDQSREGRRVRRKVTPSRMGMINHGMNLYYKGRGQVPYSQITMLDSLSVKWEPKKGWF